jgi:hypothetical protein
MPLTSNSVAAEFCRASGSIVCGDCICALEHFIAGKGLRRILFRLAARNTRKSPFQTAQDTLRPAFAFFAAKNVVLNPSCDNVVAHPATAITGILQSDNPYSNKDEIREDAGVHVD